MPGRPAINAAEAYEPFAKIDSDLQERREKLREDARILATLDPESPAYHELRTRIEQETEAANELASAVVRARQALMSYKDTTRSNTRSIGRIQGAGLAPVGLIATVTAAGDTLVFVGLAMIAIGALQFILA